MALHWIKSYVANGNRVPGAAPGVGVWRVAASDHMKPAASRRMCFGKQRPRAFQRTAGGLPTPRGCCGIPIALGNFSGFLMCSRWGRCGFVRLPMVSWLHHSQHVALERCFPSIYRPNTTILTWSHSIEHSVDSEMVISLHSATQSILDSAQRSGTP